MKLVELHVYPLKGARGIALERAEVLLGGLRHDRRFLLVDAKGGFVTQRTHPLLALVTTAIDGSSLVLGTPDGASVTLPLEPGQANANRRTVPIWDDRVEAIDVPGGGSELLSAYLGESCSVVFMPADVVRPVEAPYSKPGDRVGFADAYPLLLAARASLADLNGRLEVKVPMNRFRPNVVVEGGSPFEEEQFARVRIGALTFRMPKRCSRCQVTTVDQQTAAVGKEPLRTLATFRREDKRVHFGQNTIPDAEGMLALGDDVTYSDRLA